MFYGSFRTSRTYSGIGEDEVEIEVERVKQYGRRIS